MDLKLSDVEAKATENYNIDRLQKWLDYELSSTLLWAASVFAFKIWFYTLIAASAAALAITPLLIYTLLQEKRYGWLISFFVLIAIPPLIVSLIVGEWTWAWVAAMTFLGFFYFYCGLLRFVIREW